MVQRHLYPPKHHSYKLRVPARPEQEWQPHSPRHCLRAHQGQQDAHRWHCQYSSIRRSRPRNLLLRPLTPQEMGWSTTRKCPGNAKDPRTLKPPWAHFATATPRANVPGSKLAETPGANRDTSRPPGTTEKLRKLHVRVVRDKSERSLVELGWQNPSA